MNELHHAWPSQSGNSSLHNKGLRFIEPRLRLRAKPKCPARSVVAPPPYVSAGASIGVAVIGPNGKPAHRVAIVAATLAGVAAANVPARGAPIHRVSLRRYPTRAVEAAHAVGVVAGMVAATPKDVGGVSCGLRLGNAGVAGPNPMGCCAVDGCPLRVVQAARGRHTRAGRTSQPAAADVATTSTIA